MIGDCRTAAIVGRDGSIDWFCVPRFDSPACFAALLGTPENGRWLIEAVGKSTSSRAYAGESLVLETIITTATGKVRVTEFMPPGTQESSIVRIVEGLSGHVDLRTDIAIRFDYGNSIPWVTRHDRRTLTAVSGPNLLAIRTPVALRGENLHTVGEFRVHKDEAVPFVLTYGESFKSIPPSIDAVIAQDETAKFWRQWASHCRVTGSWRAKIMPSLLALKGLSYAPSGGIVAAATCSLPERIGGTRNWDYRYCWLREAGVTVLLDGQGADETWGGYPKHLWFGVGDALTRGQAARLASTLRTWHALGRLPRVDPKPIAGLALPAGGRAAARKALLLAARPALGPALLEGVEPSDPQGPARGSLLARSAATDAGRVVLPRLLRYADRNSMAWSRELRLPYLDPELAALGLGSSWREGLAAGWTKHALRRAAALRLPSEVVWRREKVAYQTPDTAWLQIPGVAAAVTESRLRLEREGLLRRGAVRFSPWKILSVARLLDVYRLTV